MKKMSIFYKPKVKKVKQLVKKLETIHTDNEREMVRMLRHNKKSRSKQNHFVEVLQLPRFSPIKKSYEQFDSQSPISKGEKFLWQKQRDKVLNSERVFSSLPNMKVSISLQKHINETQNPVIRNLKFLQFDRIIKEQSASYRMAKIQQNEKLILKNSFSTNNFKSFTHRLNVSCDQSDIKKLKTSRLNESVCSNSLTNQFRNSSKDREKQNVLNQTMDSSLKEESHSLLQNRTNRSFLNKKKPTHLKTNKSEMNLNKLTKIPSVSKFPTIKLQKNINSLTLK